MFINLGQAVKLLFCKSQMMSITKQSRFIKTTIMKKVISIIIVIISCNSFTVSQVSKTDSLEEVQLKNVILFPSRKLEEKINISLRVRQMIIQLKIHPLLNLNKEQRNRLLLLTDTIKYLENVTKLDSFNIKLKSGISWDLRGDPPPQPKNFYLKILTEKGRNDKAVIDRLKYLEFCNDWLEENEDPSLLIDNFKTYYAILVDGVERIVIAYELDGDTKITKKLIEFKDP